MGDDMSEVPIRVLLIEDNPGDARLVHEMLRDVKGRGYEVTHVSCLADALELIAAANFEVALVDLTLPDADGLCAVDHLQTNDANLPIVVLSGLNDEALALEAVQQGAQDYLAKGQGDGHLLSRALMYAIERKERQARLLYLAQYDQLTGLPNRLLFRDRLEGALQRADRNGWLAGLMFIDLDKFKSINDTLGHDQGDRLLQAVASRLKHVVRGQDTVARLGGDEFTVILEALARPEDAAPIAAKILEVMAKPIFLDDEQVMVTPSIGIALYPHNADGAEVLIRAADNAMYRTKDRGRNGYQFYTTAMNACVTGRQSLQASLRHALRRNEFMLYYQPQVDMRDGSVVGMEALLRWRHPVLGVLPPGQFLNVQEETGQIVAVGEWVLRTACVQAHSWKEITGTPLQVAVNVSAREVAEDNFSAMVSDALIDSGLDPACLTVEVAERVLMSSKGPELDNLFALKELGVRLAMDDFGSGQASLRRLRRLNVDAVKIGRSMVRELEQKGDDQIIVDALMASARTMGMAISAEGVETERQLAWLRDKGCARAQGYLFSEPMGVDQIAPLLEAGVPRWDYAQHMQERIYQRH